jgi:glycosyltransferase involved in cell wall biosynthesis
MKKALIITYYWPPSGGSGVQRWLKFVKHLPASGIEPVVLTVDDRKASYPLLDKTLLEDVPEGVPVHRTSTSEIYSFYQKIGSKKEIPHSGFANEGNPGFFQKFTRFLRGNLFIPDPRIGWNKFALKEAEKIICEEKIDCIITSSPPHSTQLIGLELKKRFGIPWIADLRDPWTDIYYYHNFYHLPFARRRDSAMERKVLETADTVLVVSEPIRKLFLAKSPRIRPDSVQIIPNGYDEEDFPSGIAMIPSAFTVTYTGTLSDDYNILSFLDAVKIMLERNPDVPFRLRFTGKLSARWMAAANESGLSRILEATDHLPHREAVKQLVESSVLLLVIPDIENNEGILTGKLFEYLASERPILCIGPETGDAAGIIRECEAGESFGYGNREGIISFLDRQLKLWKSGTLPSRENRNHLRFSRKEQARELAAVIDRLAHSPAGV